MRKVYFNRFVVFIFSILLLTTHLCAQKVPKKLLRSMRRKGITEFPLSLADPAASARVSSIVNETLTQAVAQVNQPVGNAVKDTPVNAQKAVASLYRQQTYRNSGNPLPLLNNLWKQQQAFPRTPLFPIFIRHYYTTQFGDLSPHMETFFAKVSSFQNTDLEARITKRLYYLSQNKYRLGKIICPQLLKEISSRDRFYHKNFRIRHLKNIDNLTPENFDEQDLVLSIERRMSLNTSHDFPIRHVNGNTNFSLGEQTYPLFNYKGPFDNLNELYRFLLNGSRKPYRPITYFFDEKDQSLTILNHNHSLWLRISQHEFIFPERLHVHLNELRPVTFINTDGVKSVEQINLNLSIPLSTPDNLPRQHRRSFLYKKMILEPVRSAVNDPHIEVKRQSFW